MSTCVVHDRVQDQRRRRRWRRRRTRKEKKTEPIYLGKTQLSKSTGADNHRYWVCDGGLEINDDCLETQIENVPGSYPRSHTFHQAEWVACFHVTPPLTWESIRSPN
jgi:hypothetical protein